MVTQYRLTKNSSGQFWCIEHFEGRESMVLMSKLHRHIKKWHLLFKNRPWETSLISLKLVR